MLYNSDMYLKSIFLVTDGVSTSVYGWFKIIFGNKNIFEFANFVFFPFCISLISSYRPMQGVI
jgi:hypothetical protein